MKDDLLHKLQRLQFDISQWRMTIFGPYNAKDYMRFFQHLHSEVSELEENPKDILEYADIMIMLIDLAYVNNFTMKDLIEALYAKMEINKKREYINGRRVDKIEKGLINDF